MKISKAAIFFSLYLIFTSSNANEKSKIINKLKNIDNIQFKFIQKTNEKVEKGKCILAFPSKLKCDYEDKNKKELICSEHFPKMSQNSLHCPSSPSSQHSASPFVWCLFLHQILGFYTCPGGKTYSFLRRIRF